MTVINPLIFIVFFAFSAHLKAEEFDASGDYIKDCKFATCVGLAGLRWSKKNPFGVAISVRMGTKPAVTDDQIKTVLIRHLNHYGIENIKFFYEYHRAPASAMALHVRGGTEGPFGIHNILKELKEIAKRAKNTNPATMPEGWNG